ncbi:hypothetical protein KsCSTR_46070 [Candidatus Kuenenia stuttgartiensis]|uniref:Uncharacterized protein n=1 Tax=Kuenenia stuttgartiensis TaxID=174633 RepID=Q1PWC7_KUEST|nr:hypothetical protein KsCSTR_46070 [Candidatus Kuenenia stuttgartiensis]CAJ71533.1 unknown protein [Candidatus Kuenenia stuttgartiensis]
MSVFRSVYNIRMPQTHFHRFWVPLKRHDDWFVKRKIREKICILLYFCVTILSFPGKRNFLSSLHLKET